MALDNSTRRGGTMVDWLVEMKEYVGFTADDERALAELLPRIEPHADGICDHFYECILRHPHAHAAITGGEKQVARLKKSLREWLLRGLSGSYDSDFYESRSRVGRMHVAIDLPQQFMFTAMNVIRLDLRAVVDEAFPDDSKAQRRANNAVDRLLDDASLRQRLGAAARTYVMTERSLAATAARLDAVLRGLGP